MSEQEFKVKSPVNSGPAFGSALIQALRKGREDHPMIDMAAGNLPIVGGLQGAMDVTNPDASWSQRAMSAAQFVPFGKLGGKAISYMGDVVDFNKLKKVREIAKRLRKTQEEIPMHPEELEVHETGQLPVPQEEPAWAKDVKSDLDRVRNGGSTEEWKAFRDKYPEGPPKNTPGYQAYLNEHFKLLPKKEQDIIKKYKARTKLTPEERDYADMNMQPLNFYEIPNSDSMDMLRMIDENSKEPLE